MSKNSKNTDMVNISTHIPADVAADLKRIVEEYKAAGLRINRCEIISEGIRCAVQEKRRKLKVYKEVE